MEIKLNEEEKQNLLSIARNTIYDNLFSKKIQLLDNFYPKLDQVNGVFVTLTIDGQLRGCIGNIVGQYPLYLGTSKMAMQAAFHDPRFDPLTKEEYEKIKIEISVLSPITEIHHNEVVVGKHGLLIKHLYNSGVLLPQVPVEQGWSKKEFLEGVCVKAGLAKDAYLNKDCKLYGFTALVFNEGENNG